MAGAPDANLACAVGRRPCEGFLNETTGTWAGLRCVGGGHPLSRHASATPKTRTWRLLTYEVFPQIGCHEGAVVRVHGVGVRPRPSARPRCVGVRLRTGEVGQVDDKEVEGRAAKAPGRGLFADMRPDPPPKRGVFWDFGTGHGTPRARTCRRRRMKKYMSETQQIRSLRFPIGRTRRGIPPEPQSRSQALPTGDARRQIKSKNVAIPMVPESTFRDKRRRWSGIRERRLGTYPRGRPPRFCVL